MIKLFNPKLSLVSVICLLSLGLHAQPMVSGEAGVREVPFVINGESSPRSVQAEIQEKAKARQDELNNSSYELGAPGQGVEGKQTGYRVNIQGTSKTETVRTAPPLQLPQPLPRQARLEPAVAVEAPTFAVPQAQRGVAPAPVVAPTPVVVPVKPQIAQTAPGVKPPINPRAMAGMPAPDSLSETRLPSLKGDEASLKPNVLHTKVGVNEVLRLSSSFLNRISTPFTDPVIVDISGSQSHIIGSEVFFLPKDGQPVGVYIFDKSNPAQTISLTLVPQGGIPGQNILVKVENFRALGNLALTNDPGAAGQAKPNQGNDNEGMLSNLILGAINGKIPGFTPVPLEAGVAKIEDIEVIPDAVFQGYYLDVYRYQLHNVGVRNLAMNEGVFYREGIKAISFFPNDSLSPGTSTFVFLVVAKGTDKNPTYFISNGDKKVLSNPKQMNMELQ